LSYQLKAYFVPDRISRLFIKTGDASLSSEGLNSQSLLPSQEGNMGTEPDTFSSRALPFRQRLMLLNASSCSWTG